jgi:ketosteroid isomerase-like protein
MNQYLFAIVVFVISLFACNSDNLSKPPVQQASSNAFDKAWATAFIDSVNHVFANQVAAGDSVGLADQYWPDAELLLDFSNPVKGSDIAKAWGEAIRMGLKTMTFTTTDLTGSSEFIIETGNYEMKTLSGDVIDRGKYVVIWQKRNKQWKLYRDIGSTSMPAAK